jgi:hypothetical protein
MGMNGAGVELDPRNGDFCLVSSPVLMPIKSMRWEKIISQAGSPHLNHASPNFRRVQL